MESIIIIGGGIAGLMAAYELSKQDKRIVVLEASSRLGGRIHTIKNKFSMPVELGAEFIHGDLPVTKNLLNEAGIKFSKIGGKMFHIEKGEIIKDSSDEYWNEMLQTMKELKQDMPLRDFLIQFFGDDKYEGLRYSAKGMAEGFDLADTIKASTIALYNEWSNEGNNQYRIEGGYIKLIDFLVSQIKKNDGVINLDCCVKKISWKQNEVNILTMCSRIFKANKIVIAVPLSALQSNELNTNYIEWEPLIDTQLNAVKQIGFGTVIKIIFEFDEAFWEAQKSNIGFIFTGGFVPVWWTQLPQKNAILTGWLGGPAALDLQNKSDEIIKQKAIECLASAFNKPEKFISNKLITFKIVNWTNVNNIFGGYSYNTIQSKQAKKVLQQPINETIFFAGEAVYDGKDEGTVEAALVSAKEAVNKILQLNYVD